MSRGIPWTPEQEDQLESLYGKQSLQFICKTLGMSFSAVRHKAWRMGLGRQSETDDFITMKQLALLMGNIGCKATRRFIREGLPVKKHIWNTSVHYLIYRKDLLKWLEHHQDMFEAVKIQHMSLGSEPQWLRDKRRREYDRRGKRYKKGFYE